MTELLQKAGTGARYTLAAVRGVNGVASLLVPQVLAKRTGVDPEANPAALYVLRLFGVRTVYLALELVFARGDHLRDALKVAPAIHASDALSAFAAGRAGQLPPKSARTGTIISSVNFILALLAARTAKQSARRRPWRR
jgi:hypothetical protein